MRGPTTRKDEAMSTMQALRVEVEIRQHEGGDRDAASADPQARARDGGDPFVAGAGFMVAATGLAAALLKAIGV